MKKGTKNYRAYCRRLFSHFSIGLLAQVEQYMAAPERCPPEDALELAEQIGRVTRRFRTGKYCPRCGARLYLSDLPQYDYVCYVCDENF